MSLLFTYSNSFSNVLNTDLVIRTSDNSQKLVIGTGYGSFCNAGFYITNNQVGIQRPPASTSLFECLDSFNVDINSNVNIATTLNVSQLNASNITLNPWAGTLTSCNAVLSALMGGTIDALTSNGTLNIGLNSANIIVGGSVPSPISLQLGNSNDTITITGTTLDVNTNSITFANRLLSLNNQGGPNSGTQSGFEIWESGTSVGYIKTGNDRSSFLFKTPAGDEMSMNLSSNATAFNANQWVLGSNGNVGIGTALTPNRLTVNGDIYASGYLIAQALNMQSCTISNATFCNALCTNISSTIASVSNIRAGNITFSGTNLNGMVIVSPNPRNDQQICAFGYSNSAMKLQVDSANTPIVFSYGTSPTASTEVMRVTGTGLGIGISNPIALDRKSVV